MESKTPDNCLQWKTETLISTIMSGKVNMGTVNMAQGKPMASQNSNKGALGKQPTLRAFGHSK